MDEYHKRILKNLKDKYGLELVHLQWYYYHGGDGGVKKSGRHYNYKHKTCKDFTEIPFQTHCLCGHKITEQCYLKKGNPDLSFAPEYLTLGNCCIQKYMKNKNRTCERCRRVHRNNSNNLCNECRKVVL